jgi:hypothetical protein
MGYRTALLLFVTIAGTATAQDRPAVQQASPITDMIQRSKDALNNLQYEQARNSVREVLALGRLKRSQEIAVLQVASAAFFPEEPSARIPDSATIYLKRLVRLMPTGPLPVDLSSVGLDSQLVLARISTFGATARPPLEITLKGTETRAAIEVVSTRPARWQLYLSSRAGGAAILLDTLAPATTGKLSLRAHDGLSVVIQPGSYEFRVLSISTSQPDTIMLRFDGTATGSAPTLVDLPRALDPSSFLPERATRAIFAGIVGGVSIGGLTWGLANYARPPKALGDEAKDGRATVVGLAIAAGAIAGGILDHGKRLPDNIRENERMRTGYLKQLGDATETNRSRIGEYKLAIAIDPEIK